MHSTAHSLCKLPGALTVIVLVAFTATLLSTAFSAVYAPTEILSLDFSDPVETIKHIDNVTENYDSGGDGSSKGYVDTVNQWYVFEGNNTDTSQGFDEPIAVIKGYNESNGLQSYAVMPYNYTVRVEFMVPSSPGIGNFYVFPRYRDVNNKYEVVVDTEYNNLVFNYVLNGVWSNIKTSSLGFTIARDNWYVLEVTVEWVYDSATGSYTNRLTATVYDKNNPSTSFTDTVTDSSLPPTQYYGLAFLGFDADNVFKVYMDNVYVETNMIILGQEPLENLSPGDLDIAEWLASNDTSSVFLKITVSDTISPGSDNKWWSAEIDVDRDSRFTETGFDYEYLVTIGLDTSGSATGSLFDSQGNYLGRARILGGGIGYTYWVVQLFLDNISRPSGVYIYSYTVQGSSAVDGAPLDNTGNGYVGDYYIYYLSPPKPIGEDTVVNDPVGDASTASLDIVNLTSNYDSDNLYYVFQVAGAIPFQGGSSAGIYRVYIDADQNPATGYSVGGIGADYLYEHVVGHIPKLWKYNGTGSDWNWVFVSREDYLYNPGGGVKAVYLLPKNDFAQPPTSSIEVLGETASSTTIVDQTSPVVTPVPEPGLLIAIVATALLLLFIAERVLKRKL